MSNNNLIENKVLGIKIQRIGIAVAIIVVAPHLIGFVFGFLFSHLMSSLDIDITPSHMGIFGWVRVISNWTVYFFTYYMFIRDIRENRYRSLMLTYLSAMILSVGLILVINGSSNTPMIFSTLIVNFILANFALLISRNYSIKSVKAENSDKGCAS